jgi:hypothetical protein
LQTVSKFSEALAKLAAELPNAANTEDEQNDDQDDK